MTEDIRLDENGVENMDGVTGSIPVGEGITIGKEAGEIGGLNVADLPALAAKIVAATGTPEYQTLLDAYEGPGKGVDFDEDAGAFKIAQGWHADANGNIVKD